MTPILTLLILGPLTALVLGTFFQSKVFQNAVSSPLRRVPGPWWAAVTGIPLKIAILSRRQVHFFHALHTKYGAFVRVAPQEIIVSDLEAFKEIHRIGTPFVKSRFYAYLNPTEPGQPPFSVFAETDPRRHAARRRLLARGFTQASLRDTWEDVVREKVSDAVQCITKDAAEHGDVDILKWWMFMAADIVSNLMFGESFDLLRLGHKTPWLEDFDTGTAMNAVAWHLPWLYLVLKWTPIAAIQRGVYASRLLYHQGQAAVTNSRTTAERQNVFAKVMAEAERDDGTMTDQEICVEAGSFSLAGTDTTATTLTYLIWAVLSRPTLQKLLQDEVGALRKPLSDSELEKLPVLNAVIKEALRLYGAAPGALPRITPAGGVKLGEYFVPAGTTVSTQAWTMHRDSTLFENPDQYDHTRWLPSASPMSDRAKAAFSPFGAGSRVCMGIHLAYMELRLATAMFFRECKGAKLAPSVTAESMEVENIFLIAPKAGECKVVLPVAIKNGGLNS